MRRRLTLTDLLSKRQETAAFDGCSSLFSQKEPVSYVGKSVYLGNTGIRIVLNPGLPKDIFILQNDNGFIIGRIQYPPITPV